MKKTFNLTLIISALLLAGIIYLPRQQALANGNKDDGSQTAQQQTSSDSLEFETPKGGSLSLIVRRALQIVDAEDSSFALSEAQILFAETGIVNRLGARSLEVGEHIKVEKSLLKEFALKSQELSAAKIAAWQEYANQANFKLDGSIEPVGTQKTPDGSQQTPNANQEGLQQSSSANTDSDPKSANDDIGRAWLIGISVLIIAYYLFRNLFAPSKRGTQSKVTRRKTSRKR